MREAIQNIAEYVAGMDEAQFRVDKQRVHAVVWNLTVLGEAARAIPDAIVAAYPDIP